MVVLGTIRRGKVKIKSKKQMAFLHANEVDHTHYVKKDGEIKKIRHTCPSKRRKF